ALLQRQIDCTGIGRCHRLCQLPARSAVKSKAAWIALTLSVAHAQVTWERLQHTEREPQNWLTYSGSNLSQRHSQLTQIDSGNVKDLELKWVFQAASFEKFEATPLVSDGILYTVQP